MNMTQIVTEPTTESLTKLMRTLMDALAAGHFLTVNNWMRDEVNIEGSAPLALVAIIRATYTCRTDLPYWQEFVGRVFLSLSRRGVDVDDLMEGIPRGVTQ